MADKKSGNKSFILFKNDLVKTYTNSNGNSFGILNLSDSKELKYLTVPMKLIKGLNFSKEEGKKYDQVEYSEDVARISFFAPEDFKFKLSTATKTGKVLDEESIFDAESDKAEFVESEISINDVFDILSEKAKQVANYVAKEKE